jgi:MFS family permease
MIPGDIYKDKRFWTLGASSFLFFASFNMIIPELPDYLSKLGGADYKGMIIGLFSLAAGLARPFSGKFTDNIGRIPVLIIGCLVCVLLGLLYPLVSSVAGFLLLRFLHGFSAGFKPTADVAYVADIVPANRRGEALGMMGIMGNLGMSFGPVLGSEVTAGFGLNAMFYTSTGLAMVALLITLQLPETLKIKYSFRLKTLKINPSDIYEKSVRMPAAVMFLTVISFGIVLTLVPDFARHVGLQKQGYYFMVFTLVSLVVRLFTGKLSDKRGRSKVMIFGVIFLIISMIAMSLASNVWQLFLASALLGISTGFTSPTLFAWTIDVCNPKFTGRGLATFYIAMEAGITIGSVISAAIYNNHSGNFKFAFLSGALMSLTALGLLFFYRNMHRKAGTVSR